MVRGSLGGKRAPGAVFGEAQTVGDFAEENARDESEDGSRPREVFFFVFFFVFIFFVTRQRRLLIDASFIRYYYYYTQINPCGLSPISLPLRLS